MHFFCFGDSLNAVSTVLEEEIMREVKHEITLIELEPLKEFFAVETSLQLLLEGVLLHYL